MTDRKAFISLALRDILLVAAILVAWTYAAPLTVEPGPRSDFLGLLVGLSLGVATFLFHEWGHWLGAWLSSSAIRAPESLRTIYLFSYDSKANSRGQFLAMSFSGFAATGVAVWAGYALLPDAELASRVARGAILSLAFLTVFVEFPLVAWSLFAKTLPPVEVFDSTSTRPTPETAPSSSSGT